MTSHTPGPWIADSLFMNDDQVVRVSAYDGTPDYYHRCMGIAECFVRDSRHDKDAPHVLQAEANARVMAAAPDLLAALHEGRRAIGDHIEPNDCYSTGPLTGDPIRDLVQCPACSFIAMYDAAIAKAVSP